MSDPSTVSRHICRISLKLFAGDHSASSSSPPLPPPPHSSHDEQQLELQQQHSHQCSQQQQQQQRQQLQLLIQRINTVLISPDSAKNPSLSTTLLSVLNAFQSLDENNATMCQKSFTTIGEQAAKSFDTSTHFKDKLYSTQASILSILYLHNYFTSEAEGDVGLSEERIQLILQVSSLFAQLVATSDVKSAIAEEFERRGVTTSIWLRLNQQTHTTDGLEILKDIASLQSFLGEWYIDLILEAV